MFNQRQNAQRSEDSMMKSLLVGQLNIIRCSVYCMMGGLNDAEQSAV